MNARIVANRWPLVPLAAFCTLGAEAALHAGRTGTVVGVAVASLVACAGMVDWRGARP